MIYERKIYRKKFKLSALRNFVEKLLKLKMKKRGNAVKTKLIKGTGGAIYGQTLRKYFDFVHKCVIEKCMERNLGNRLVQWINTIMQNSYLVK